MARLRSARLLPVAVLAIVLGALAFPAVASGAEPFVIRLYRDQGYVPQYTTVQCVAASAQSMANMVFLKEGYAEAVDRSSALQRTLHVYARNHDAQPNATTRGSDPKGWAAALEYLSVPFDYRPMKFTTYRAAVRHIAYRIAVTRQPVGVIAWAGRHAMYVTGFVATADPRRSPTFDVLGVYLSGPLTIVGQKSDPKNAYRTYLAFAKDFRKIVDDGSSYLWAGGWVIVSPEGHWGD
jgi:hypothetical protein